MKKILQVTILGLEAFLFIVVVLRFKTVKVEILPLLSESATVMAQLHGAVQSDNAKDRQNSLHEVDQKIRHLAGTWTITCKSAAKYGYPGVDWAISMIHRIPEGSVMAAYGSRQEPCEESRVFQSKGQIGAAEKAQDTWDKWEGWLTWPGGTLLILKVVELLSGWREEREKKNARKKGKNK